MVYWITEHIGLDKEHFIEVGLQSPLSKQFGGKYFSYLGVRRQKTVDIIKTILITTNKTR